MTFSARFWPVCCLGAAWTVLAVAPCASAASVPELPGVNAGAAASKRPTPPLPGTRSRADTFRELLEMAPSERAQALADRTEHQRQYLEARLRDYQNLSRGEREAKLKQLELTDHLDVLMRLPREDRAARLELVSPELRPLVEDRLRQWDLLPTPVQQSVLEHETTANYFLRVRPEGTSRTNQPPGLEASAWKAERFGSWREQFAQFISLPAKEQQETLKVLPPTERAEMEAALSTFAKLPPEQRKICLDSFERFGRMSKDQRDQFLQNAERWRAMSASERATWRALVNILPPTRGGPALPGTRSAPGAMTVSNQSGAPLAK